MEAFYWPWPWKKKIIKKPDWIKTKMAHVSWLPPAVRKYSFHIKLDFHLRSNYSFRRCVALFWPYISTCRLFWYVTMKKKTGIQKGIKEYFYWLLTCPCQFLTLEKIEYKRRGRKFNGQTMRWQFVRNYKWLDFRLMR